MRNINQVGLLINFKVLHLKDCLKRVVKLDPSASLRALRGEADD